MAMIKKDASTMAMPLSMQRTEPAPIDAYSIWYSLADAQEYAAGTGTNKAAYVGQIITVVDESNQKATAYVIKDTAGTLQEVGSGTAQPMKFVDNESQMLALTEIEAGQQVYRADTKTVWIFKGGDASSLSNWVESAALTKADIGLGNVDNTADAEKSVKSADTLTTARTIGISGAVTGTATEFDGSENITINTTSVDGSKIDANSEIRVRDVTVSDAVATDNIATYTSAFGTLNVQAGAVALAGANGDAVAINNVATPTADKDAANKKYVDDHQLKWGTF